MFFIKKARLPKVLFRLREPSKKLGHVVRISLVQFSASELHDVSSHDRLKVEKVKKILMQKKVPKMKNPFLIICLPRVSGRFLWVRNPINTISQGLKFAKNVFFGKIEICQESRAGEAI